MYRTFVSAIFVAIATTCSAQDYDIVITNGRVIDPETGLEVPSDEFEPVSVCRGNCEPIRNKVDATRREQRCGSA
ncbi:hypothetical protein NBRC116589_18720 [Ruegeria sp. HU-ET01832]